MTFCTQCHSTIIDKLKMSDVTGISLVSQERLKQCVFKVFALPNSGSHTTACQFIYDWMWKRCNSIYSALVVLQGSSGGVAQGYKPAKVPGEWKSMHSVHRVWVHTRCVWAWGVIFHLLKAQHKMHNSRKGLATSATCSFPMALPKTDLSSFGLLPSGVTAANHAPPFDPVL